MILNTSSPNLLSLQYPSSKEVFAKSLQTALENNDQNEIENILLSAPLNSFDKEHCKLLVQMKFCSVGLLDLLLEKSIANTVSLETLDLAFEHKQNQEVILTLVIQLNTITKSQIQKAIKAGYTKPHTSRQSVLYLMLSRTPENTQNEIFDFYCKNDLKKNNITISSLLNCNPRLINNLVKNMEWWKNNSNPFETLKLYTKRCNRIITLSIVDALDRLTEHPFSIWETAEKERYDKLLQNCKLIASKK